MIFRPYYYFETGCAAYLFGCGGLGKCAVVDAHEPDVDGYVDFAASKGMRITHVIDTHVHADHRSGGPALAKKAGACYCLHGSAAVNLSFEPLRDGQELEIGNTRIEVRHTPGHTPESTCLVVKDLRRGPEPWFVLTGDTLFVGAVGRPDLPGRARENAGTLYDSIHAKLLTLPDELELYPGHFAGSACGAGMSGKPTSSIGFEKRWNPMLKLSREAFIDALADVPPSADDVVAVLKAAKPHIRLALALCADAGLRAGEVRGLEWQDVDLKDRKLIVRQTVYYGQKDTPKSGHERQIPLTKRLHALLTEAASAPHLVTDPVAPNRDGKVWGQNSLLHAFQRTLQQVGLQQARVHDLRHFFVTEAFKAGGAAPMVQKLAGHRHMHVTARYAHADEEATRAVIEAIDRRHGS